jgi:hypothetical protein
MKGIKYEKIMKSLCLIIGIFLIVFLSGCDNGSSSRSFNPQISATTNI